MVRLAGFVLLAVLLAGAVAVYLLAGGDGHLRAAGPTDCPADSVTGTLEDEQRAVCTVSNLDRTAASFAVPVVNTGRVGLTVTDIPFEPLDVVGFTPHDVTLTGPEGSAPFAPFTLAPGEQQVLEVSGALPPCEARTEGGATTFRAVAVAVRVLTIPRQVTIELDPAVRLVSEPCLP